MPNGKRIPLWAPIPGYPGYVASPNGYVRSLDRLAGADGASPRLVVGRILAPCINKQGYQTVKIMDGHWKSRKSEGVHRLIASAFLGPIPEGACIDHVNRNPSDNRLRNLRIVPMTANGLNREATGCSRTRDGKWWARMQVNRQCVTIGIYETKERAEIESKKARERYINSVTIASGRLLYTIGKAKADQPRKES